MYRLRQFVYVIDISKAKGIGMVTNSRGKWKICPCGLIFSEFCKHHLTPYFAFFSATVRTGKLNV